MHVLTIFRDGAAPTRAELPDGVHVVGSGERCRVRLPDPGVSERHALLMLSGDKASVEDMGSDSGTLVNAVPVARRTPVTASTPVTVGPYTLTLAFVPSAGAAPSRKTVRTCMPPDCSGNGRGGQAPAPAGAASFFPLAFAGARAYNPAPSLPLGVMVAQLTLDQFV